MIKAEMTEEEMAHICELAELQAETVANLDASLNKIQEDIPKLFTNMRALSASWISEIDTSLLVSKVSLSTLPVEEFSTLPFEDRMKIRDNILLGAMKKKCLLNPHELEVMKLILKGPEDVNTLVRNSACSPLECAVHLKDITFFRLLMNFNADILSAPGMNLNNHTLLESIVKQKERFLKVLPYKTLCPALQEMESVLTEKTLLFLKEKISITYDFLFKKISEEYQIAKSDGKKCLVLTGEDHTGAYSELIEIMALLICSDNNFKHLALELDENRYKQTRSLVTKIIKKSLNYLDPYNLGSSIKEYLIENYNWSNFTNKPEEIGSELGMTVHLVDDEKIAKNIKNMDDISLRFTQESMEARDKRIGDNLKQLNKHCIAFLGAFHLNGVAEQVKEQYHVVLLNTHEARTIPELPYLQTPEVFYKSQETSELELLTIETIKNHGCAIKTEDFYALVKTVHEEKQSARLAHDRLALRRANKKERKDEHVDFPVSTNVLTFNSIGRKRARSKNKDQCEQQQDMIQATKRRKYE